MEVGVECDLKQLIADGKKAAKALHYVYGQYVELADWTFRRLIELTPKSGKTREGDRVADSWELKFQKKAFLRELAWSVISENEVIGYLEYGTREHWIYPKSPGGTLHWIDEKTGEDRFSKGHKVLGIKPVGMIRKTISGFNYRLQWYHLKASLKISN